MRAIDLKELLARVGREASVRPVFVEIEGVEHRVAGVRVRSRVVPHTSISVPDRVVLVLIGETGDD